MLTLPTIPTPSLLLVLLGAALVIAVIGTRLTAVAERLAISTGLGEAIIGGALLGAATSLSGTVTSVSAAAAGHTELAISNAIGGIAVQTLFLAVADAAYRPANLEHAAASPEILANTALLAILLSVALVLPHLPAHTWHGVHLGSAGLLVVYGAGLRRIAAIRARPMWFARRTVDTREEPGADSPAARDPLPALLAAFAALALVMAVAGYVVAAAGLEVAQRFGLRESLVGASLTATITSLPELVTTLAAVRRGALQLAVGGIIGGNTFDILFLAFSDVAYRDGSLYHAMQPDSAFWIVVALLMTAVLSFGLIERQRYGPGRIGLESVVLVAIYAAAVMLQLPDP